MSAPRTENGGGAGGRPRSAPLIPEHVEAMTADEELQTFLEELTMLQQDFDAKCARLRHLGLGA